MSPDIKRQMDAFYARFFALHGLPESQVQLAMTYAQRGYSNAAAVRLARSRGNHQGLIRGTP